MSAVAEVLVGVLVLVFSVALVLVFILLCEFAATSLLLIN